MRACERGFLLLTCPLGDPLRKGLTPAQLRTLASRAREMKKPDASRDLVLSDLQALGYTADFARRILYLLSQEDLLDHYLGRCEKAGCVPLSRLSDAYPAVIRTKLGPDAPASLWARGDLSLLDTPRLSLVGSREIQPPNRSFAWEAGTQAARQGYTLVSGNARGADRMAQSACRRAGGKRIIIVADELEKQPLEPDTLYLSEDGFDLPFSASRALSRNRLIHALGEKTLVAQSAAGTGGTWDGTTRNLRAHWSPVYCFDDGSEGISQLCRMGAEPIKTAQLQDISALPQSEINLFDQ